MTVRCADKKCQTFEGPGKNILSDQVYQFLEINFSTLLMINCLDFLDLNFNPFKPNIAVRH